MGLSCPLGISRFVPAKAKFFGVIFWPYNKSFIDQACSVKDGWRLASLFFCISMDVDFVSVHKNAKKELDQYPASLTEQAWLIAHIYFNLYLSFYLLLV